MKFTNSLIVAESILIASLGQSFAQSGLTLSAQSTNAVLMWPSTSGNIYLVENETNLNGGFPWIPLTNYLPAATGTNWTTFVHSNGIVYPPIGGVISNTGGGSGVPLPSNGSGGSTNSSGTNATQSTSGFYSVFNVSPVAVPAFFSVYGQFRESTWNFPKRHRS